jgi:hypothetical protein
MKINDLRDAITDGLSGLPGVQTVAWFDTLHDWSQLRCPALIIEERTTGAGDSLGTPYPGEYLAFSVCCLIRGPASDPLAIRKSRNLASAVSALAHATSWGLDDVGLADLEQIDDERFRPEWQEFEVTRVDFRHHALVDLTAAEWASV